MVWAFAPRQVFSQVPDPPPFAVGCFPCVLAGVVPRQRLWGRERGGLAAAPPPAAGTAGPVLSPAPLLSAAQLGVFPWARVELVPEISNGPIMPDVFTAFGRK